MGGPPQRWDHELIAGDTYSVVATVTEDGTAVDLTGASGEVQLRAEPGAALVLEPTVTISDAAAGEVTWTSSAASTASLSPGRVRYALRLTYADGTVSTVLEGSVTVRKGLVA